MGLGHVAPMAPAQPRARADLANGRADAEGYRYHPRRSPAPQQQAVLEGVTRDDHDQRNRADPRAQPRACGDFAPRDARSRQIVGKDASIARSAVGCGPARGATGSLAVPAVLALAIPATPRRTD